MLNDGGGSASKGITTPLRSVSLTDATGNNGGTITTNNARRGYAVFPVGSAPTPWHHRRHTTRRLRPPAAARP
jgi:hypothetical protein